MTTERESLYALLEEVNSLCRSAFQIAKREGAKTNWAAFRKKLTLSLERQQAALKRK